MTHWNLEIGNIIVVLITSIAVYFIPTNLSMLLILPAIGFQVYVFHKYYEQHTAKFEYEYAVIALILFILATIVPDLVFKSIVTLGMLNLSRSAISLYFVGEKESADEFKKNASIAARINMQYTIKQHHDIMQKKLQDVKSASEKEIAAAWAKKDEDVAALKEKAKKIVNDYMEGYADEVHEQDRRIACLEKERKKQANQITEQKRTIDKLLSKQSKFIAQIESQNECSPNKIISNKEIHAKLLAILREAKYEVDIMSPWINNEVVNSVFEDNLDMLMRKNGKLKVVYGINMQENDTKRMRAEKILSRLQKKYGKDHIQYKYFSSHSKLIICDDDYYIITSCNPLSNDGMSWEEIGEISANKKNLKAYKKKYFSNF